MVQSETLRLCYINHTYGFHAQEKPLDKPPPKKENKKQNNNRVLH